MSTIAVFIALGGGAYAAMSVPRNSVNTNSIRDGQVKAADVGVGAVGGEEVADDSLGGADVAESRLGRVPDAAALAGSPASAYLTEGDLAGFLRGSDPIPAGDLGGTYAAPSLRPGSVGPSELGSFPAASLADPIHNVAAAGPCRGQDDDFPSGGPPYPEIQFTRVEFDTAGMARQPNPGNDDCFDSLIVPVAGTYIITAGIFWQPEPAPSSIDEITNRKIELRAENPGNACCGLHVATEGPANVSDGGSHDTVQSTGGIARLLPGARIFLKGFQTTGTEQDFRRGSLQAAWIGP